jgi:hypothetical protein
MVFAVVHQPQRLCKFNTLQVRLPQNIYRCSGNRVSLHSRYGDAMIRTQGRV